MNDFIVVGDTLDFKTSVHGYPSSAGYTLKYRLIPRVSGSPILITAGADGDNYRVQVAPSITANYAAGEYTWYAWVEKSGIRVTVDDGLVTIRGDPSLLAASDGRTHAKKVLDAIEAVIENRATKDQEEYSIAGRQLKRIPVADLLAFRDKYRAEVANLDAAEKVADGLPNPRHIYVRLDRA